MNQYIVTLKKKQTYEKVLLEGSLNDVITKYKNTIYKVDKIMDYQKVSYSAFQKIIKDHSQTSLPYGLVLHNRYILCEELALNHIIDYNLHEISFSNLNQYLQTKYSDNICIDSLNELYIFQTESYYYNGKEMIPLIFMNGFHVKDRTSKKEIQEVIHNSVNTLFHMMNPSGKFVYGYYTNKGYVLGDYNVIRHLGSLWSLCLLENEIEDSNHKEKIEKSFDYIIKHYAVYRGEKAFIFPGPSGDFRIGANALALLALCEYYDKYHDDRYMDLMEKIANGMLSCQQPNGCFYHGFNRDLDLSEKKITVYFDGEAVFALLKYYSICKKPIYYQSVVDAFYYFIENGYERETDHWIAHALRELFHFTQDENYILFLNNCCIPNSTHCYAPAKLEFLASLYGAYSYLKKKKVKHEYMDDFPIKMMRDAIRFRIENLLCYYIGEEVALYLKNEDKVLYGFHCAHDSYRMRIDDIQHTVSGLYYYLNLDFDIENLEK